MLRHIARLRSATRCRRFRRHPLGASMPLTARAIPILSDNYAWLLRDEASRATAVVDPADAAPCLQATQPDGGRLDLILNSHHHDDHIAGVDAVRARFGAKVV